MPNSIIYFLALQLILATIMGIAFSPGKSPTLRSDFAAVSSLYDATVSAKAALETAMDTNNGVEQKNAFEAFSATVRQYEALPKSNELKDPFVKDWFRVSLFMFQQYEKIATSLITGPRLTDDKPLGLLSASTSLNQQILQTVGVRIKALDRSAVYQVVCGFISWLDRITFSSRAAKIGMG